MRSRRNPFGRRSILIRIQDAVINSFSTLISVLLMPFRIADDWWRGLVRWSSRMLRQFTRIYWTRLFISLVTWPFYITMWMIHGLVDTVVAWWPRVQWMCLLQGLPAVAICGLVTIPLFARSSSRDNLKYDREARAAVQMKDYQQAEMLYRALLQNDPENSGYRFNLAQVCWARGEREAALRMIESLAPRTSKGYPPAHAWLAEYLLTSQPGNQALLSTVEAHLRRAIAGSGEYVKRAHALLGQRLLESGRLAEAEKEFKEAAKDEPRLWVRLAEIHARQGMMTQAMHDAERALEHFESEGRKDQDNDEARMFSAQALTFLRRFEDAAAVLEAGYNLKQDSRYAQWLGQVYLSWADATRAQTRGSRQPEQALLVRSFNYDPYNSCLLRHLLNGLMADGGDAEMVRGVLRSALASAEPANVSNSGTPVVRRPRSGVVNMLLAIEAAVHGYNESSRTYLERARTDDSNIPRLMSELALYLVNQPPTNDQQARQLVELGLRAWSSEPNLRYARAVLSVRRREWLEAMMDLDLASKSAERSRDPNVHELYALVCQQLGMVDKAKEHLQRVRQIQMSLSQNR